VFAQEQMTRSCPHRCCDFQTITFEKFFNGPFVHPKKTLNVCAWGTKYPPCSVLNILDSWLRTVARIAHSCSASQAESNELFSVIIKCVFVKIFRRFQRDCFRRFSADVQMQRLREEPRHLLVINLMRAAIRRGIDIANNHQCH